MAIIVKQGSRNLVDCLDCGSVIKYTPKDISKIYNPPKGPYEMEGSDSYFIYCPCNSMINVTAKISSGVAQRIEEIKKEREWFDYDI